MIASKCTQRKRDRKTRVTMTQELSNRGPTQSPSASLPSRRAVQTPHWRNFHHPALFCQRKTPSFALPNPYAQQYTSLSRQHPLPSHHLHSRSFSSLLRPSEIRVHRQSPRLVVDIPEFQSSHYHSAPHRFHRHLLYSMTLFEQLLSQTAVPAGGVARRSPTWTRRWLQDSLGPLKDLHRHVIAFRT